MKYMLLSMQASIAVAWLIATPYMHYDPWEETHVLLHIIIMKQTFFPFVGSWCQDEAMHVWLGNTALGPISPRSVGDLTFPSSSNGWCANACSVHGPPTLISTSEWVSRLDLHPTQFPGPFPGFPVSTQTSISCRHFSDLISVLIVLDISW